MPLLTTMKRFSISLNEDDVRRIQKTLQTSMETHPDHPFESWDDDNYAALLPPITENMRTLISHFLREALDLIERQQ